MRVGGKPMRTIWLGKDGCTVEIIDQTRLPHELAIVPLEELEDVGGLMYCPDDVARGPLRWMVMCYIGTEGGRTRYGHVRPVFYSDAAAPIIERLMAAGGSRVLDMLKDFRDDHDVKLRLSSCKDVSARYEDLLDKAGDK